MEQYLLQNQTQAVQKLYAQAAPQGDPNAAGGAQGGANAGGDQFYDADFKDVSDDQ